MKSAFYADEFHQIERINKMKKDIYDRDRSRPSVDYQHRKVDSCTRGIRRCVTAFWSMAYKVLETRVITGLPYTLPVGNVPFPFACNW